MVIVFRQFPVRILIMATFVRRFPVRVLAQAAVSGRCNYCTDQGAPAFSCHPSCIQSRPLPQMRNTIHQLHTTLYQPLKYELRSYRYYSSDSSGLAEDDVNVHYDSLVKRIRNGNIQLIDVREPSELAEFGQITNSIHIPLGDLADALNLPQDKFESKYGHPKPESVDDDIVFHCRSGKRSMTAINIAKEIGYSKARHFPGGWLEWAEKNNLPYA
ncbi:thiosulfate sulfurtransferase 18-like [Patiria miniata]|uniref:Sulfurtransferase n=1 Tax=Patiria miniata TaxID=46514 RepID=A0A913ZGS1_PATMI|nr:thiosulfate sulfurtransferase 18-like [Patiria miniata]